MQRTAITRQVRIDVLTEAGYKCAVPTCRGIIALDIHHITEVKDGGSNEASNLIALCPTCHALYTRGTILKESIDVWKTMLVGLSHAFDQETISNLLFLYKDGNETDRKKSELTKANPKSLKQKLLGNGDVFYQAANKEVFRKLGILFVSGDGVLKFSHLIASGLATFYMSKYSNATYLYRVEITDKGRRIVDAWFSGNRNSVREALYDLPQE
jgi:HNH endonuclease